MKPLSGKFVVRIPPSLHRQLKEEALAGGLSLNALCLQRLQKPPESRQPCAGVQGHLFDDRHLAEILRLWKDELIGIVIFGSAARGDATEMSDIDLLLVVAPEVRLDRSLYRRWDESQPSELPPARPVSPQFVHIPKSAADAGGLWYEAAIDGLLLWERDTQVSRFLRSIRETMACGRIRRGVVHGSAYWVKEFER